LFSRTLASVIEMMGSRITSASELKRVGNQLMPHFFRGVFAAGTEPANDGSTHFVIVNTMDRPPGLHWCGLYREKGHQILYDSFGRSQGEGDLNLLSAYNVTEPDAEQPISTDPELQYCGQACIAFGIVCQRKGMKAAKFI
jgi:hypothetical protein